MICSVPDMNKKLVAIIMSQYSRLYIWPYLLFRCGADHISHTDTQPHWWLKYAFKHAHVHSLTHSTWPTLRCEHHTNRWWGGPNRLWYLTCWHVPSHCHECGVTSLPLRDIVVVPPVVIYLPLHQVVLSNQGVALDMDYISQEWLEHKQHVLMHNHMHIN